MSDTPLHLVLLEFADTSRAPELMDGHNRWIEQSFDEGSMVLAGSVPGRGGAVIVRGLEGEDVERLVGQDPFVEHGVVVPTAIEIVPSRIDDALLAALG